MPPGTPLARTVIYELHVRGYTRHPSSKVRHPGTFLGLCEKIPYLQSLGVTAVQLMPVLEFDELDQPRIHPGTGEPLKNYWGYSPLNFFAPKASYAAHPGQQVREFKQMVKEFHRAGIEVILDVVYNHTCEGNEHGSTLSFRGLANSIYYILDREGRYHNYSGCGNTVNCNHPVVRDLIISSLVYLATELHVDGFRFDLASILGRGEDGRVLEDPPLIRHIAEHPLLAGTKLLAEAWDAAGLHQLGKFPAWGRWAEFNGHFRDDVRHWVRSDPGAATPLAKRICGSLDLYGDSSRHPHHSINFITCHDGFPLNDLVSYNRKHNWANGENDRDGCLDNLSYNCDHEGPTDDPRVNALRQRQMRNFLTLLLISQGVPFLSHGDEFAPHAARQQQRLLPGQRDLLGRLGLGPEERGAVALHQDDDRLAPALLRHLPRRVHPQDDLARHTVRRPGLDRKEPDLGVPDAWLARPAGPPRDAQRPLGDATVRPPAAPGAVVLEAPGRYRLALAGRHRRGGERRAGPAGGPLLPVAAVDRHPHLVVRGLTKGARIPAPFNTTIIIFSVTEHPPAGSRRFGSRLKA